MVRRQEQPATTLTHHKRRIVCAYGSTEPADRLVFSPESLEFRDEVRDRLSKRLRELAVERALRDHRDRFTEDDLKAVLRRAVQAVMAEFGVEGG